MGLVVVLAGYKDRMDKFFSFIPGMSSRIGNHIDFPNYEVDELFEISKVMSRDLDYEMTDEPATSSRSTSSAAWPCPSSRTRAPCATPWIARARTRLLECSTRPSRAPTMVMWVLKI